MDTLKTLCEIARYDSGTHFLDSGGAHGRHHEQPPVDDAKPIATFDIWGGDVESGTIETALYLAKWGELAENENETLQEQFRTIR